MSQVRTRETETQEEREANKRESRKALKSEEQRFFFIQILSDLHYPTPPPPKKKKKKPDFFTLELGPHSSAAPRGATAPSLISKDLALGADFVFEQYREGVADRAAGEAAAFAAAAAAEGRKKRGCGDGDGERRRSDAGKQDAAAAAAAAVSHNPVDDVLRELGLGEFALDSNSKGGNLGSGFGTGKSSAGDGREEEGARFLRLLRQAAAPQAMLQG